MLILDIHMTEYNRVPIDNPSWQAWPLHSRVHPLNAFPNEGVCCYVKRDDELSLGISGSKLRKYSSIIPHLIERAVSTLVIIAGTQSNNLLAALQVACEHRWKIEAFLLRPWQMPTAGNYRLSSMMLNEEDIHWVDREQWAEVESIAADYIEKQKCSNEYFLLNEGASVPEALSGAMTLATDIIENERAMGVRFQHLFIDAGTGFTAASLLKAMKEKNHPVEIHVLVLADDEICFSQRCFEWTGHRPAYGQCFRPSTARSFGAVNQTIRAEIRRMALEEGILCDPVYSAKLFHEARKRVTSEGLKGNVLIVHSGGALSLAANAL